MANVLLLNGPNLNLLGQREPERYGTKTLTEIEQQLQLIGQELGHKISCFQSNAEHALIDRIHTSQAAQIDVIICNPGGLTHTSVALRDAFTSVQIPFIEVHLSNIMAREQFRKLSYLSDIAIGSVMGFGPCSYRLALLAADDYLNSTCS